MQHSSVRGRSNAVPTQTSVRGRSNAVPKQTSVRGRSNVVPKQTSVRGRSNVVPKQTLVSGHPNAVPKHASVRGHPNAVPPRSQPKLTSHPVNRGKDSRKQALHKLGSSRIKHVSRKSPVNHKDEHPATEPKSTKPHHRLLNRKPGESIGVWRARNREYFRLQRIVKLRRNMKLQSRKYKGHVFHNKIIMKRRNGESVAAYQKRMQKLRNRIKTANDSKHSKSHNKSNAAKIELRKVPAATSVRMSRRTVMPTRVQIRVKQKKMKAFIKSRANHKHPTHKQVIYVI